MEVPAPRVGALWRVAPAAALVALAVAVGAVPGLGGALGVGDPASRPMGAEPASAPLPALAGDDSGAFIAVGVQPPRVAAVERSTDASVIRPAVLASAVPAAGVALPRQRARRRARGGFDARATTPCVGPVSRRAPPVVLAA